MADYFDPQQVFDDLTKTIGRFVIEATGRKVVVTDGTTIPKVDGEFVLIDLTDSDQVDWQSNEWVNEEGLAVITHNYQVTYTMTAYRGNAFSAIAKVLQCFNLPWMYEKYFPVTVPYAYSSSSTISRLRVPLNVQTFENRAVVLVTFNVCFGLVDNGAFEDIEEINMQVVYKVPSES